MPPLFSPPRETRTASERIRAARLAQLVTHYEQHGWPLELVQLLNRRPLLELSEALEGFSVPVRRVA